MNLHYLHTKWPMHKGGGFDRPSGYRTSLNAYYVFFHFYSAVTLTLDGKELSLSPHACVIIAEGTQHSLHAENAFMHDWAIFRPGEDGELAALLDQLQLSVNTVYYPSDSREITQALESVEFEFFGNHPYKHILFDAKMREILVHMALGREKSQHTLYLTPPEIEQLLSEERSEANRERIDPCLLLLHNKLMRYPTASYNEQQMLALARCSRSSLLRRYKAMFGKTPSEEIHEGRIRIAKEYLRDTVFTVENIADMVGYANVLTFTRRFKAQTGMSPGEYRKTLK